MSFTKVSSLIPALGSLAFGLSSFSQAAILIDNLQPTASAASESSLDHQGKALAFTMGADAYTLDSVNIRLLRMTASTEAPNLNIGIYSSVTTANGLTIGTKLVDFAAPANIPNTGISGIYNLLPASAFTLSANTTYFFVMYNLVDTNPASTNPALGWKYNTAGTTTTAGVTIPDISTNADTQVGIFPVAGDTYENPSTWTGVSSTYNDFELMGTLVPEPSAITLCGLMGTMALLRRRRA